jgi:hypothetical protein
MWFFLYAFETGKIRVKTVGYPSIPGTYRGFPIASSMVYNGKHWYTLVFSEAFSTMPSPVTLELKSRRYTIGRIFF